MAKIELEELLNADQVNMEVVKKKVKEITGLKENLLLDKIKTRVDAKEVLNAEQREKAKKLRHHKKEKSGKSKGMELKEETTGSQKKEHKKHH